MEATTALVVFIIVVALIFDYTNGMHDAANSIATVVSTRVLSPGVAVAWAAFFNFIAFAVFGTSVAKMIGGGLVDLKPIPQDFHLYVLLAGLVGVITWNLITWYLGLPTSSSHALIGGYAGAAIAASGGFSVIISSGWYLTLSFIVLAPLMGMSLGFLLMLAVFWIFRKTSIAKVDKGFRVGQLFSAAAYSLGHGGNDAQKTMGIITAVLIAGGFLGTAADGKLPEPPLWVILSAHSAIALGTLTGGWRIVKTMGSKIAKLQPVGGFCAETAGAITLAIATHFGIPVSTTHTITGAIVGVGSTKRLSAVKWGVAGRIVWAWVLTIPAAGIIAAISYFLIVGIDRIVGR
ncbi:MAG: inorganic phosphate transporter, PiT family [Acidobacteria bacterium]|jgi:PiT family inorganic phosphate transporter|nr:inorganic phosphate transporter, PiT family [Acidobacteriota bacterium]